MSFGFPQSHIDHMSSDVLHIGFLFQISFEERCAETTAWLKKNYCVVLLSCFVNYSL